MGCPLQYSGLENAMDCMVHGVSKSRTQLSNFHFHFSQLIYNGLLISDVQHIKIYSGDPEYMYILFPYSFPLQLIIRY